MSRLRCALVVVLALLAPRAADAKDTSKELLDDAKSLVDRHETMKAAERFGEAIALAQAAGDVDAEGAAAEALASFCDDVALAGIRAKVENSAAKDLPTATAVLVAVMKKLDPTRCGAFVSAPILARNVLLIATETGDLSAVGDAVPPAKSRASKGSSGQSAAAVAAYADGMKSAAAGTFDAAGATLDSAAALAAKGGWCDLAAHASAEAAVSWWRAKNPGNATASVAAGAALFDDRSDRAVVNMLSEIVRTRLAGAPAEVRKPMDDLMARLPSTTTASATGGAGGKGAPGGKAGQPQQKPVSEIGKILPSIPKGKPFVSVKRDAKGFGIHWATKPKESPVQAFRDAVRVAADGGVALEFRERSVALVMLDLEGLRGLPGDGRTDPSPVLAFYLLAEGESWGVSKDGVVTVAR